MASDHQPVWQPGKVVATELVADDIRRITIARPATVRAQPGTHIDVEVDLGDRVDIRSYSVVSSNSDGSSITISVLRTPTTRGGSSFMHRLQVGDVLRTTQPLQNFPMRVGAERYVLVAGGIGITAIIGMAAVLRALGANYTFVYVARSTAAAAYLTEMRQLHGDRLLVHLDADGTMLDVPALISSISGSSLSSGTELYMCGPIRLMDAIRRQWLAEALPIYNLRYETFGNSGWFDAEQFLVRIPRLGLEAEVGTHTTILEALTNAGADLMFDCRKGECGLCVVNVLDNEGIIDHRDVFFSERQKTAGGRLCTCVSRVVSDSNATGSSQGDKTALAQRADRQRTRLPVLTIDIP